MLDILLRAGADPNKPGLHGTPLIGAAGSGHLAVVKKLIAAGADIHSVYQSGEFIQNAYSAASGNSQYETADFLKSLGARNPKPAGSEPFKPGVANWNDFSELLVKCSVEQAAEALAKMINGKVLLNVYGQSFLPGKKACVVARPRGMDWCNILQVAPPPLRFDDLKNTEAFAAELAEAAAASVLSIEYSDTADAASVLRIEPNGTKSHDKGWDHDMLEEMLKAMGDEAPAWARKQLAKTGEDEPRSTERLEMLAEQEKFVVAAFDLDCEPCRNVDVEFVGYGKEAFDGVAFVSD